MRFDKGSLSNLINAVLTSRCHSSKSSVHLNNAKNTIIVNNMIFMHRAMKIPTGKGVGGGLDRKPGAMHADVRWDKRFPLNLRVEGFLEAVKASCERTGQEIVRLVHADALMARRIEGKRKASKLPQLKDLLLHRPLVSARMIQKTLKVSPEGASYLLRQLGAGPREVTGRRSYRVWGI